MQRQQHRPPPPENTTVNRPHSQLRYQPPRSSRARACPSRSEPDALVLALITTAALAAYPLAPIQLTLISTVTIGVPGFVLALGPNRRRYLPGFLRRALRFAIPTGLATAACAYAGYQATRLLEPHAGVAEDRTTATLVALWTLLVLARPLATWKLALVASMVGAVALIISVPPLGHGIFLLDTTPQRLLVAAVIGAAGAALVETSYQAIQPSTKIINGL